MPNKTPKTRVVNIPAQFLPLIQEETERRGCFAVSECMGHILKDYFGTDKNGHKAPAANPQVLKGKKVNA